MEQMMSGAATGAQFGALVAGLRSKGESVEEITGLVRSMRQFSLKVEVAGPLVDTCGTGGDQSGSINVSTIAALVLAGSGARVAKHGNRAVSSPCGSADVFEALGVKIDLGPQGVATCINQAGIGFCMAPIFHPAMRYVAGGRKELGVRTIFNFLGPLTNPAGVGHQVVGVSDAAMAPKMAEVLKGMGAAHALVVRGFDGLDEISNTSPSTIWELKAGEVASWVFDPADFGISLADPGELTGGDAQTNAGLALQVLNGEKSPKRDVVVINAAAGLVAADLEKDFPSALRRAADTIDSGAALAALDRLREVSNRA